MIYDVSDVFSVKYLADFVVLGWVLESIHHAGVSVNTKPLFYWGVFMGRNLTVTYRHVGLLRINGGTKYLPCHAIITFALRWTPCSCWCFFSNLSSLFFTCFCKWL